MPNEKPGPEKSGARGASEAKRHAQPAEAVQGFMDGILLKPKVDFHVLLIEDHPDEAARIREWLENSRDPAFTLELATALSSGLECLERAHFDLVLVDLNIEGAPGLLSLRAARAAAPNTPTIALSESPGVAKEAMLLGASDLLIRGEFNGSMLIQCMEDSRVRRFRRESREDQPSPLLP